MPGHDGWGGALPGHDGQAVASWSDVGSTGTRNNPIRLPLACMAGMQALAEQSAPCSVPVRAADAQLRALSRS
jgi:hypothetical protein